MIGTSVKRATPLLPSAHAAVGLLPEFRVLLSLASDRDEPLVALLEEHRETLHWAGVLAIAERERATVVLAERLRSPDLVHLELPGDVLEFLGRTAMVHHFRILELERRLEALLDALEAASVPVVLLKGAALWHAAYDAPAERPMGDVDLLVRRQDSQLAWSAARDLGWARNEDGIPRETFDTHHHLARLGDDSGLGLALEIHTGIFPPHHPFRFSANSLWREAKVLPGRSIALVPSHEHLMLHNVLHFAWSHGFGFGVWKALRDVEALRGSGELDWDSFVRQARVARGGSSAYWTLRLAREWGAVPIPPEVLAGLGCPVPRLLVSPIRRHIAAEVCPDPNRLPPVRMRHRLWELAIRPGRSGHGEVRPWSSEADWGTHGPDDLEGSARGPARILRRAGQTARYLAGLAVGS